MTVVDASVAVKWFFPETDGEAACGLLLEGGLLAAPALIRTEVAGAITKKVRLYGIDPREAELAMETWSDIGEGLVTLLPDEDHLPEAFRLALALQHRLQDCLYLAAAKHHGAPLVTADKEFAAKARASYPNIRLLSEL
jgi:predicted nucleic acid-binding protein